MSAGLSTQTGACSLSGRLQAIEAARLAMAISASRLAAAASLSASAYREAIAGRATARASTIRRLEVALSSLRGERRSADPSLDATIRATYGGFVALLAPHLGVDPAAVHAQDPRRGATADPAWRAAAQVRQAAIYLTNTAVVVKQGHLARVLGLTPAAVCLGLRSVEDRRDDPAFDALLDRIAADVMGVSA